MLIPASTHKNHILKISCAALGAISFGLALVNYVVADIIMLPIAEIAFSLFCFYVYLNIKQGKAQAWFSPCVAIFFTILIMYGIAHTKPTSGLILWTLCLPALYHVFFNRYLGSIISLLALTAVALILQLQSSQLNFFPAMNYILVYITIWIISFSYENIREHIEAHLKHIALTDPLTQAHNRLALIDDANNKSSFNHNHYLLHFDLDDFKQVNDTHGHSAGDEVLKRTCQLVNNVMNNSRLYRIGGEEFCVIFESKDEELAKTQADALRVKIEQNNVYVKGQAISITISGGLIPLRLKDQHINAVLQQSDHALYQAKNSGRNQIRTN